MEEEEMRRTPAMEEEAHRTPWPSRIEEEVHRDARGSALAGRRHLSSHDS
jgi:hypothetical protein